MPFFNYKPLKLQLRVFLAGHTVAMATYYVMERTISCSPIIGECLDIMIVASSDKEWLQWPIETLVLETVLNHLNAHGVLCFQLTQNICFNWNMDNFRFKFLSWGRLESFLPLFKILPCYSCIWGFVVTLLLPLLLKCSAEIILNKLILHLWILL